jgi:MFS family permease
MLLIGATGFAAISALAAFAPSAGWLIAARAGMGVFGAMLMPSTLSLLRSIFTDRDQRRFAIAVWASMFSAGSRGPIVGGILLEHFAWGSVFLMAVPVLSRCWCSRRSWCPRAATRARAASTRSASSVDGDDGADRLRDQGGRGARLRPAIPVLVSSASASARCSCAGSCGWSSRCSTCGCSPAARSAARCS